MIKMLNIEFLEQVAKEQIDHPEKLQIEYQNNNIILVNTFLDELYNKLYTLNNSNQKRIYELLRNEKTIPIYDDKIGFFKVVLVGIFNNNNYNLNVLADELRIRYAWIVHQLLEEIKKYETPSKKNT